MDTLFLLSKTVDWSLLRQGFSIPTELVPLWQSLPAGELKRGERRKVKFLLDGVLYDDAELINQKFDEEKFEGHPDVFQVRYPEGSAMAKKLREIFASSYKYIEAERAIRGGKSKSPIKVPTDIQERLMISSTLQPDVLALECVVSNEMQLVKSEIANYSEYDFESESSILMVHDESAGYVMSKTLQKVRKLDRSIGDSLKQFYDFRCQMTGEAVGEEHGVHVVEAHHIDPFTTSLNNDASNIIIISPSYHRIIHQAKPSFDRKKLAFIYPNGLVDEVKLKGHLVC